MACEIYNWIDIESQFSESTLLIGNGASMAIDGRFGYQSLIEYAEKHGLMNSDVNKLFNFFKTTDFELVLRLVWQATNINMALEIEDDKTRNAYVHVRDCLIKAVRDIHPEYQEVSEQMPKVYNFIKKFKTILSLNYDLILYWTVMYGLSIRDNRELKDCFLNGEFESDWTRFREPMDYRKKTTLVFYPHGSLVLCRNKVESEFKIVTKGTKQNLLESILSAWNTGEYIPLFVSEGTVEQKINSIKNSNYLNTVYREVFADLGKKLVIYGWEIGEQDMHILERIKQSNVNEVAISVYSNNKAYCNRVEKLIKEKLGSGVLLYFFDSASPNCWNN
ncbi:DUF4917 family protein [Providencia rettgeri]|uniref:DUF4917 family protein n=1 Tax=Providencia rettgeri TaxID=587 RepID=UPI001C22199B|nr:DUF4917 family protein [Providencia rettgeri]QXB93275.1 DUF4917 family protein [Providencia rettgeri]